MSLMHNALHRDRSRFIFILTILGWAAVAAAWKAAMLASPARAADAKASVDAAPAPAEKSAGLPRLPMPVTSFGAAVLKDHLYVLGGHVGDPHQYSKASVSRAFLRIELAAAAPKWEALTGTRALQGLALVGHGKHVYRVGGLEPRNSEDDPGDLHSVAEVARFDPATNQWEDCTPLPEPRSSHDAAVVGNDLIVVGGWSLAGKTVEGQWHTTVWAADLTQSPLKWRALADAPFKRRAMSVAAAGKRVVVIGGIEPKGGTTAAVSVLDLKSNLWTDGATFPSKHKMGGFGSSAFGIGATVYANGWDTPMLAYDVKIDKWSEPGAKLKHRRFFHRLVAHGESTLLVIAGAGKAQQWDDVEVLAIPAAKPRAAAE